MVNRDEKICQADGLWSPKELPSCIRKFLQQTINIECFGRDFLTHKLAETAVGADRVIFAVFLEFRLVVMTAWLRELSLLRREQFPQIRLAKLRTSLKVSTES